MPLRSSIVLLFLLYSVLAMVEKSEALPAAHGVDESPSTGVQANGIKQQLKAWQANTNDLLLSALIDWSIIIASWLTMSATDSLLITVLGILLIAGRLHALGAILHDSCHLNQRKTFRFYALEALAGWPISTTTDAMTYHHLRHHRYVGTAKDPYLTPTYKGNPLPMPLLYMRGLMLPTWWTIRPVVGLISLFYAPLQAPYAKLFLQDRSGQSLVNNKDVIQCARADVAQLCSHLSVMSMVIIWQLPFVTGFLIPIHIAGVFSARRIALEHEPMKTDNLREKPIPFKQQASITMNLGTGWMEQLFLSPHNLGLHTEHHRFPSVAYKHLPKVQALGGQVDN